MNSLKINKNNIWICGPKGFNKKALDFDSRVIMSFAFFNFAI